MTIYLDASALVKLVVPEPESRALRAFLSSTPRLVTSVVAEVEVARAARSARSGDRAAVVARDLLGRCNKMDLSQAIRSNAAAVDPAELKSLDAIHLASALHIADLIDAFVTYDRRLGGAAKAAGLEVVSPGR